MSYTHFVQVLVIFLCLVSAAILDCDEDVIYARDGDLILGGLFPMHNFDVTRQSCAEIREPRALKTVEAMAWAINKINNDSTILPDFSLGFEIYDTCFYDMWTLGKSIHFIPPERTQKVDCSCSTSTRLSSQITNIQCSARKSIIGVVGAARSASSIQAATLFGLYKIPQVSYLSTSDELSNKNAYKYFLRVVPPDRYQIQAIIDIILHYDWSYVSFLYSDDDYGRNGHSEFTMQAEKRNICIAWTQEISDSFTIVEMNVVVKTLRKNPYNKAVVVILFMHLEEGKLFFESVLKAEAQNEFTWLASDGIGSLGLQGLIGVEAAALGTLSVIPFSKRLAEYDQYIVSEEFLNTENPWVEEYIDVYSNCSIKGFCGNSTNPTDTLVMDSVFAFAHALHVLIQKNCKPPQLNSVSNCTAPYDGDLLLKYLSNSSFESLVNGRIQFNENGESAGKYSIDNIQMDNRWGYSEVRVGEWNAQDPTRLKMTDRLVRFYTNKTQGKPFRVPISRCSTKCQYGYAKKIFHDFPCCWDCQQCLPNEAVINETECVACEPPEWPGENITACVIQVPDYMSWNRWDGLILILLSALGFSLAISSLLVYLLNFTHPFILNSDPVPTLLITLGILLCLTASLLVAIPPTVELCYLVRMLPGIGMALIFYPFCLKCVRLYRIFRHAKQTDSTEEAKLLNVKKQFLVVLVGLTIQITFALTWIITIPPAIQHNFVPPTSSFNGVKLHIVCNVVYTELVTEILINGPMLVLSCFFTFLARQLPDNNYEARTSAFLAYAALVIAVAFNLTYFTLNEPYEKMFYRYTGLILIAILFIFCIYLVKVYAVYFGGNRVKERTASGRSRSGTTSSTVAITKSRGYRRRSNGIANVTISPNATVIESTYL